MGFFSKIAEGLRKTKDSMMGKFELLINSFTKIDENFFEELEELLITCDIGVETSLDICSALRAKVKEKGLTNPIQIKNSLKEIITEMLGEDKPLDLSTTPSVVLIIGVNGAGKTTTIGKLAAKYKSAGKKVIVAAADTFRAAAIDQLEVWTERAGVDIVKHSEGSDPAAVVFDAVTAAKSRNMDLLICDTAGRLHNKKNLMEELKKISRIIREQGNGCALETLLVLDATTGQNAVNQAKLFSEVADITGIVLTKLDGTAKGGIIISIHKELGIPVKLVGVGEKLDDLQEFNAHDFVEALFENQTDNFEYNYERLTDNDDEVLQDDSPVENEFDDEYDIIEEVEMKTDIESDEIQSDNNSNDDNVYQNWNSNFYGNTATFSGEVNVEEIVDEEIENESEDDYDEDADIIEPDDIEYEYESESEEDYEDEDEVSEKPAKEKGGVFGWLFKNKKDKKKNKNSSNDNDIEEN